MSNPAEIAAIAKGLTAAQRAALIAFPDGNPWLDEYSTPPWPNIHVRAELADFGTMRPNATFNHAFRLTHLGQLVAQHLKESGCG